MIPDRARVGVRKHDRFARCLHDIQRRGVGRMRTVDDYADTVHFLHHLSAELGQPGIVIVTATGSGIAQVISEQHLPHPECVVKADHVDVVVERIHALDIETQRKFVLRAGAIDVLYLADQNEAIGMLDYPAATFCFISLPISLIIYN